MEDIACMGVLFSVPERMEFTNLADKTVGMEHERSTGNIAFQGAQISLLHPVADKGSGSDQAGRRRGRASREACG